jgi:hypothetical protein
MQVLLISLWGLYLRNICALFFTYGNIAEGRYPDSNGDYTSRTFPRDNDTEGLTWSITQYFWESFYLNGQNRYISDYNNLFLVEEIAHVTEDSWAQNKIVLSTTDTYLRKVNHFGLNYDLTGENGHNVDHVISKAISLIETDVYINKHMRNKESVQMFKIVCDRGNGGVWRWTDSKEYIQYGNRSVFALTREIAFMGVMLQYMSGSRGNLFWGSPQSDSPADGYNAIFGASTVLHTPITIDGQNIILSSFRQNLTFHRWFSKQSYDGGTTWVQHKASAWRESEDYLPLRIATTASGYVVVFACRPYGVEPQTIKFKAEISNTKTYVGEITANDWKSCYPVEEPNRKDYFLKIYKV